MLKDLANFTKDDSASQEAAAMRKDIPVQAEVVLRERMCSAILVEYAATLLNEGKKYDEIRKHILEEAAKIATDPYLPSTFSVQVITDLNNFFSERESRKTKIKNRFFSHKDTRKALTKFSDPHIHKEAQMLSSGMEHLKITGVTNATAQLYMEEALTLMKKKTDIPFDFFVK